jgi:predicted dehydrogenase
MIVLIIGLGSISKKHINALNKDYNNIEFYALRSGKNNISEENVIDVNNIKDLKVKPDFVIISNPTNLHYSTIELMLNFKIPMFIEKPPFHTLIGIEKLLNSIVESKILNYVACNLRFHPCIMYLKNTLDKNINLINEVNIYCGSYLPDWRPTINYKDVYSSQKNKGGGVHLDLFHEVDFIYWIFGQPDTIYNHLSNKSTLNIDSYDYANYILGYKNFNISLILNYYRIDKKRCIEIVFKDETLFIDLLTCKIINDKGTIIFEDKNFDILNTYKDQMNYFMQHLKNKTIPMNTLEESINALKITLVNE